MCKVTEDSAVCWKPDGSPNQSLTDAITASIRRPPVNYDSGFKIKIGKKRRILFIKSTLHPTKEHMEMLGMPLYRGINYVDPNGDGWEQSSNFRFEANSNDFDGTKTQWRAVDGVFDLSTTESDVPMSIITKPDSGELVDLKPGIMKLGNYQIEILSIRDRSHSKPFDNGTNYLANGKPSKLQIQTDITYRILSRASVYLFTYAALAHDNGQVIEFVSADGKPLTSDEFLKLESAMQNNPVPQERTFSQENAFGFRSDNPANSETMISFYSASKYCKKLLVTTSRQDVFVIQHVKLDPK